MSLGSRSAFLAFPVVTVAVLFGLLQISLKTFLEEPASRATVAQTATVQAPQTTEAAKSTTAPVQDEAPVAAEARSISSTVSAQPASALPSAQEAATPYSLTSTGVGSDVSALGLSISDLKARGISVLGHVGSIPKRCSSGQSGSTHSEGLALKASATYPACPDGGQPVYKAYRPDGYWCSVIYNQLSGQKQAILAHEIGHCLYFAGGQYKKFDIDYKELRDLSSLGSSQINELVADDYMICIHGLDTSWGHNSYYSRYGVARPDARLCGQIRSLMNQHF